MSAWLLQLQLVFLWLLQLQLVLMAVTLTVSLTMAVTVTITVTAKRIGRSCLSCTMAVAFWITVPMACLHS